MRERIRSANTTVLLAVALAVGALFGGSVVSVASPQATVIHTRTASCGGLTFQPASQFQAWNQAGNLRIGEGWFRCNPGLPNGAVVTSVQFTVRDAEIDGAVTDCALVRASLTLSGATPSGFDVMADLADQNTGETPTPGTVRMSDSTISFATVINKNFAYYLQCRITTIVVNDKLGIYGAVVTYKISSDKG